MCKSVSTLNHNQFHFLMSDLIESFCPPTLSSVERNFSAIVDVPHNHFRGSCHFLCHVFFCFNTFHCPIRRFVFTRHRPVRQLAPVSFLFHASENFPSLLLHFKFKLRGSNLNELLHRPHLI